MRNGWVKLHRQSLDSRVFQNADLWRLWCWILLRVNSSDSWADENTQIHAGQMLIGRHYVADSLEWTASTTRNRLDKLEAWGMITLKSDNRGTILTVCNWETYQNQDELKGQPVDSKRTTGGHL